jgi:hypothetical protein
MCQLFLIGDCKKNAGDTGETVIYGDAVNEPILRKGTLKQPDVIVVLSEI